MRSTPLRALAGVLCSCCFMHAHAQTPSECLDTTGYAFEDNASSAWLFANRSNSTLRTLFAANGGATSDHFVSCQPPVRTPDGASPPVTAEITANAGATTTSLRIGTGLSATLAALVNPGHFHRSTATVDAELLFNLDVVADDPGYTGSTTLTIKTRYAFADASGAASGTGRFGFGAGFDYVLSSQGSESFRNAWPGPVGVAGTPGGSTFDTAHEVSVPVNYSEPIRFHARFESSSDARGGPLSGFGTEFGSASASTGVAVTFEFSVPEGFSVVFPMTELIGVEPPRLGIVAPVSPPPDVSLADVVVGIVVPLLLDDE